MFFKQEWGVGGVLWFGVVPRPPAGAWPGSAQGHPMAPPAPTTSRTRISFKISFKCYEWVQHCWGARSPQPSSRGQPPSTPLFAPLLCMLLLSALWAQNPQFSPLSLAQVSVTCPEAQCPMGVPTSPVGFGSPGSILAPAGWARAGGAAGATRSRPRSEKRGHRQKHRVIHEVWCSSEPRCCTGTGPAEPPLHLHVSPEVTKWGCHPVTRAPGL